MIAFLLFSLLFTLFSISHCDQLTPAPAYKKLIKENVRFVAPLQTFPNMEWANQARNILLAERITMRETQYIAFAYDGAPRVDIIFKDESASRTGSPHYRTMWNVFMWSLRKGILKQDSVLFDGSYGGDSAIAFVYYAKLLGLQATVYIPADTSREKINQLVRMRGARVFRGNPKLLASRPREDAQRNPRGVYFNYAGNAARANEELTESDRAPSVLFELKNQLLRKENITTIDHFITTVNSGALLSDFVQTVREHNLPTKIFAVDTEFSVIYDFAVNGNFRSKSAAAVWQSPGIPEMGFREQPVMRYKETTSFNARAIDGIVKLPDLAIIAALRVLQDNQIDGGPSSAANFLAALVVAANEPAQSGGFTTIGTVLVDSGSLYRDTYLDDTWVDREFHRHGGIEGVRCWQKAIEESLTIGWNPMNIGLDKGCPTSVNQNQKVFRGALDLEGHA